MVFWMNVFLHLATKTHAVDTYGLDNDDFNTEELEEAVADIQDTLGADNYEDQLPQPEVSVRVILTSITLLTEKFKAPNTKYSKKK